MKKKDVDIAKFKKEYEEGLSQRDLAKIYNVGQTTIRRWMKDFNVKPRSAKESSDGDCTIIGPLCLGRFW